MRPNRSARTTPRTAGFDPREVEQGVDELGKSQRVAMHHASARALPTKVPSAPAARLRPARAAASRGVRNSWLTLLKNVVFARSSSARACGALAFFLTGSGAADRLGNARREQLVKPRVGRALGQHRTEPRDDEAQALARRRGSSGRRQPPRVLLQVRRGERSESGSSSRPAKSARAPRAGANRERCERCRSQRYSLHRRGWPPRPRRRDTRARRECRPERARSPPPRRTGFRRRPALESLRRAR